MKTKREWMVGWYLVQTLVVPSQVVHPRHPALLKTLMR